jgi:hypothetical protein
MTRINICKAEKFYLNKDSQMNYEYKKNIINLWLKKNNLLKFVFHKTFLSLQLIVKFKRRIKNWYI